MNKNHRTPNLSAVSWTTAGDVGPLDDVQASSFDIHDRVAATAQAGYIGMGLVYDDLILARDTIGLPELAALMDAHSIVHLELEMLNDWFESGRRRQDSDKMRWLLLEMAHELDAAYIKVAGQRQTGTEHKVEWGRFCDEFATLCEDAASLQVGIAVELMAHTNVADVEKGKQMIDHSDYLGAGLVLDLWHLSHGGAGPEKLETLDPRYVSGVELSDGLQHIQVSLQQDSVRNRYLCGEGELNVEGYIKAIQASGWNGIWGVEVMSEQHRRLGLEAQVTRSFQAASSMLLSV
ncbi:sugar phosphate isomerase/epimerase family protein [Paenarthrobacter sp. NPDC057981]|uniref:sugar phosphate isomerase/epimerase family protein n=1 Tax=Paenarthrobacter sp. NPDC057981 TaxID=3346297 RepID=UPI0036DAF235